MTAEAVVTDQPATCAPSSLALPTALVDGLAKGEQLASILEQLVAASPAGAMLPSERDLAQRYDVARMTVRGAIGTLEARGLVHRIQGQGTFVTEPRLAKPVRLTSFSEDMRVRGMTPTSLVLSQELVPSDPAIGAALRRATSEPVVRIQRVRLGDGQPIALERTHLPAARFPGLERVALDHASLYAILADRYGCEVVAATQRIAAVRLTAAEAHLLHADPEGPALRIERLAVDRRDQPVEFVRSLYPGDRYEFHTEQRRTTA